MISNIDLNIEFTYQVKYPARIQFPTAVSSNIYFINNCETNFKIPINLLKDIDEISLLKAWIAEYIFDYAVPIQYGKKVYVFCSHSDEMVASVVLVFDLEYYQQTYPLTEEITEWEDILVNMFLDIGNNGLEKDLKKICNKIKKIIKGVMM